MKKALILILFGFISSMTHAQSKTDTLIVKTNIYCDHCMECSDCQGRLVKDFAFNEGIRTVVLDDKAMTLTITYNPKKTNPEKIRKAISLTGYDADDVKADVAAYNKLDECCHKK